MLWENCNLYSFAASRDNDGPLSGQDATGVFGQVSDEDKELYQKRTVRKVGNEKNLYQKWTVKNNFKIF